MSGPVTDISSLTSNTIIGHCVCYLLFKVSSVLFVHQHQIKEVAYRELLVDIPHGGCQVISCEETGDVISCISYFK